MSQKELVKKVFEENPNDLMTIDQISTVTGITDLYRLRTILSVVKKDCTNIVLIDLGDGVKRWGTLKAVQLRLL